MHELGHQHTFRVFAYPAGGTNVHLVSNSLDLQGARGWANDGRAITLAINERTAASSFTQAQTLALHFRSELSTPMAQLIRFRPLR